MEDISIQNGKSKFLFVFHWIIILIVNSSGCGLFNPSSSQRFSKGFNDNVPGAGYFDFLKKFIFISFYNLNRTYK